MFIVEHIRFTNTEKKTQFLTHIFYKHDKIILMRRMTNNTYKMDGV